MENIWERGYARCKTGGGCSRTHKFQSGLLRYPAGERRPLSGTEPGATGDQVQGAIPGFTGEGGEAKRAGEAAP